MVLFICSQPGISFFKYITESGHIICWSKNDMKVFYDSYYYKIILGE